MQISLLTQTRLCKLERVSKLPASVEPVPPVPTYSGSLSGEGLAKNSYHRTRARQQYSPPSFFKEGWPARAPVPTSSGGWLFHQTHSRQLPNILSFYHSLILSFSHSLILSFSHSLILSLYHSITLSFYHSLIHSLPHSPSLKTLLFFRQNEAEASKAESQADVAVAELLF